MSSSLSTICRHAITHCANVENMPQFGHRIRSARERAKLKAEDVAEAVGYSSKYVYALENGTNTPTTDNHFLSVVDPARICAGFSFASFKTVA